METLSREAGTNRSTASTSSNHAFHLEDLSAQAGYGLWVLTFDLPGEKVNKFSREVMAEFESLLTELEGLGSDHRIEVLMLQSGKVGNFIAGADINLIRTCKNAEDAKELASGGQKLLNRWEDLPFPTIVAIDGTCLGGGCELSLASTAIVMSDNSGAKIGLPETMLGIIPGMGGCVRMPIKVGIATALDLILGGKQLNGERAYKSGLADALVPKEDFRENAKNWIKTHLSALKAGKRLAKPPKLGGMGGTMGSVMEGTPFGRALIFKKAKEGVLEKTKGKYPALLEAISVIRETGTGFGRKLKGRDRDFAMAREAEGFGRAYATDVCANLIRLFFMTEAIKKATGLPEGKTGSTRQFKHAGVLGAGVMGGGIAQLFAEKSIATRMKDITPQALTTGIQSASKIFKKQLEQKRINRREFLQKVSLISPTLDFEGFQGVEAVVEAVVEKMDIKKKVLQDLETRVPDSCVIASNTSSLSISEMQTAMKKPERFVGMHFFNPVHRMPLIEVIRGEKSSDEAVSAIFQFSKQIGKTPIVVKDAPGFLVNRLLLPYLNEAMQLLSDGVSIPEIDEALLDFGMPMGPVELIDEVGVDVGEKVVHILHDAFGERMSPSAIDGKLVAANRLGKKNGKGFYEYAPGGRHKKLDPSVYSLLGVSPKKGILTREEIVDRCILPMVNEAARCLEEKVVLTAADVDLGMIMGTGFPPFRGGLLRYADSRGLPEILDKLKDLNSRLGIRFQPASPLVDRAANGQKFHFA